MKQRKKYLYSALMLSIVFFLSGCVKTYKETTGDHQAGDPTGEGWVYNLLVKPMSQAINYLVNHFDWNYGFAIIVITLIVRIIILPLGLYQAKKTMIQSEKIAALKPQLDIINKNIKEAQTQEEKLQANMQLQQLYRENNVSMLGGIGCLPLLIQMPIFTALFYAAKYTPGISESTFLGVDLGKPSLLFVILAGAAYLLQGAISLIGVPEEQKKTMKTMMFTSPIMIVMLSLSAPAGVSLYWIVGGIFGCIQSLITNLYHKPKIRKEIAEALEKNPPKVVVDEPVRKDVTPKTSTPKAQSITTTQQKRRNEGKQHKKQ